jgi:hypothetical protein
MITTQEYLSRGRVKNQFLGIIHSKKLFTLKRSTPPLIAGGGAAIKQGGKICR